MFRRFNNDLSPFVDEDTFLRTFQSEGRLSREESLKRLSNAVILTSDIIGMYREGEDSPWSAVRRTRDLADNIKPDGIKYLANYIIDLRIQWLLLYVNDDIINEVLGPFRKVIDSTRDRIIVDNHNVTFNGTRLVKIPLNLIQFIPHIVSLGSCGMQITMKGVRSFA
ncbi:hypothetical protein ACJMK2_035637 [Sinanodonta woodiana]|uniref:Uncharacterized protein n=1 Tax=Sinanodonta woodiana TaxID=1069815 RepID=A0ABD3WWY2_SINWO